MPSTSLFLLSSVLLGALAPTSCLAAPLADTALDRRAWGCKGAFQCRAQRIPANSDHVCLNNACTYVCDDGYVAQGVRCVPVTSSTTTTPGPASSSALATTTTTTTTTAAQAYQTLTPNALSLAGVTGFAGINTNAILSWFHTNLGSDSTNGHSWCGYPYSDAVPGFAPSLKTMLANFGGDYVSAATAYCGLEAIVTTPDGRNATLYLADAFDDTWVRTPSSLDIVFGSFPLLFGRTTTNKNDVVKQASWSFTGNRNDRYKFKGLGSVGL
ncbi:hypothetical protein JCM10212_003924 [Sporobolomyces blumeae]